MSADRGPCEYVYDDGDDCAVWSPLAVSVRHGSCCDWQRWAVCAEHADALRADLAGLFEVTATYAYDDAAARSAAERRAA